MSPGMLNDRINDLERFPMRLCTSSCRTLRSKQIKGMQRRWHIDTVVTPLQPWPNRCLAAAPADQHQRATQTVQGTLRRLLSKPDQ
jgi:hypothetical protein